MTDEIEMKKSIPPEYILKFYYFLLGRIVSGNIELVADDDTSIYCKDFPELKNVGDVKKYLMDKWRIKIITEKWEKDLPDNFYKDYLYDFLRGYISLWGYAYSQSFCFGYYLDNIIKDISNNLGFPNQLTLSENIGKNRIHLSPLNSLDFIGRLYSDDTITTMEGNSSFRNIFLNSNIDNVPNIKFVKSLEDAVTPSKSRLSDTGYDLTLIRKIKEENGVHFFNTGIRVSPSFGWYFDIVPRSSISKMGWMLANNVGIIDQSYTGDIIVALVPVVNNPKEIVLPLRIVQMIPRKVYNCIFSQVETLDDTQRANTGGIVR